MYFSTAVLALTAVAFQSVLATDLCKESWWYDIQTAKCNPCTECRSKSWVMEPCARFKDTLCVDLDMIARSIAKNIEEGARNEGSRRKWHEMEGRTPVAEQLEKSTITKSSFIDFENQWGRTFMVVLAVTLIMLFVAVFILVARFAKRYSRYDNRKTVARARLFSRDRLNTTEYMNNLATLDRRLAMDEILEKRKRAIFEPQLLNENLYTDEVFVDISGIPRNLQDDHDYEELDHRRCLLRMQEQQ